MTTHELLFELDPWLQRRCRLTALRIPGVGADEVYQRAIEEFLVKIDRWLQQAPTVSPVAQARTLLGLCVRHVETSARREGARRQATPEAEDGDGLELLAPPVEPTDDLGARELLAQIRSCTTPPCALCLLSLRVPVATEVEDAERAKAWKKGGANAVPRPVGDAWSIYEGGLQQPALVAEETEWKEHVGVAWYTDGPVDALGRGDRNAAAGKVERYANRAAEDLRAALLQAEEA